MKKTVISRISNKALATAANRYIETINQSGLPEAKSSLQYTALVNNNNIYQESVNTITKSEYVKGLAEKDVLRMESFRSIKRYLSGLLDSPVAEMKSAAQLLYPQVELYGTRLDKLKKIEISDQMLRLTNSLLLPEFAEAVTTVSLTTSINDLKYAVEAYEDFYLKRGNVNATKRNQDCASKFRRTLESSMKAYFDEASTMTARTGDPKWTMLLQQLTERFYEIATSVSRTSAEVSTDQTTTQASEKTSSQN